MSEEAADSLVRAVSRSSAGPLSRQPNFERKITRMKEAFQEASSDTKKGTSIVKTIKAAEAAIPDLTSGDPAKTLTALFGVVGSIAEMTGPQGVAVSLVLSLLSSIISSVSHKGDGQSMTTVILNIMQQFHDQTMWNEISGEYDNLAVAKNTMDGYEDLPKLSAQVVEDIMTSVPNNIGTNVLGKLGKDMSTQASQATNSAEAHKVLEFVDAFCILSMLREMLLQQKWILLKYSGHADDLARGLDVSVIPENMDRVRIKLSFLHHPSVKEAVVASVYNPSDWPNISAYMKHVGVPDPLHPKPTQGTVRVVGRLEQDIMAHFLPSRCRTARQMPAVNFTRVPGSKCWLIHRRVEKLTHWFGSSFDPPRHTNLYLKLQGESWWLSVFRIVPHFGVRCAFFEESYLSPEEYIQKGHVNDFNSINVTFIDDKTCLLTAKDAPCGFFQFDELIYSNTMPGRPPRQPDYSIWVNKGVPGEDLSHWMLESLTPK